MSLELGDYSTKGSRLSRNKEHRCLPIQIVYTLTKCRVVEYGKKSAIFQNLAGHKASLKPSHTTVYSGMNTKVNNYCL